MRTVSFLSSFLLAACTGGAVSPEPATPPPTPTVVPTPTGDTGEELVCEVTARDGVLRSCDDPVVWCDSTDENIGNRLHCCECDQLYCNAPDPQSCSDVDVPPIPETCSPFLVGHPTGDVFTPPLQLEDPDHPGLAVTCSFPSSGTFTTLDQLLHEIDCIRNESDGSSTPVEPPSTYVFPDFATYDLVVRSRPASLAFVGVYGTNLVLDEGCPYLGGPPPPTIVVASLVDKALGPVDVVQCSLSDCPVYTGPPIP